MVSKSDNYLKWWKTLVEVLETGLVIWILISSQLLYQLDDLSQDTYLLSSSISENL